MTRSTRTRVILLALAGLAIGGYFALKANLPGLNPGTETVVNTGPQIGGPFTLTDQTGKQVTDNDFLGTYMLVFFGFTNCPDICPASLQVLTTALEKLSPEKAEKITPVFISVDPARDTPQKLAEYVKSFHPRLVGLTGTEQEVADVIKTYRVYANKVKDDRNPDSYNYDHSTVFYLMAEDGSFVAPIPHTTNPEELRAALDKAIP